MPIDRLFDREVDTKRLARVGGSHKEAWSDNLSGLQCHIQAVEGEPQELLSGAYATLFKMWCAVDTDIIIGDRVIDGARTFTVRGLKLHDYGGSQHVAATLSLGKE